MFPVGGGGASVGVVRGSGPGWSDIVIGLSLAAPPPVPRGMSVDRSAVLHLGEGLASGDAVRERGRGGRCV
jgi:hypothetical protein